MLIELPEILKAYGRVPSAIVHGGSHLAQESAAYEAAGISDVVWIEANPALIPELRKRVGRLRHNTVLEACLGSTTGEMVTFHIAEADNGSNKGQSSSLLELGTHLTAHPEVSFVSHVTLETITLDDLLGDTLDGYGDRVGLNLDLQGAELIVLAGAEKTIQHVDLILTELNIDSLYVDCALLPEYDEWLMAHGFELQMIQFAGCSRRDGSVGSPRWVGWADGVAWRVDNPRSWAERYPDDWADWYPA